jgi:hypothetical protein
MPKLVIPYGHPEDPAAFEDYYANGHIPNATDHMPNVVGRREPAGHWSTRRRSAALLPRLVARIRKHL